MPRPMTVCEYDLLETTARKFCELREEYRRRKATGTLSTSLENRMVQSLNALDLELDGLKKGDELAHAKRLRRKERPERSKPALWRSA